MKVTFHEVYMEVTNFCNFDCTFCPSGIMQRKKEFMDTELAFKIIDQISDNNVSPTILFHILGEPLLYRDIFKIIKYANSKKLNTILFTNGGLLTEEIIDKILDVAPTIVAISLQTLSKELFFHRNSNITFEKYEQQIKEFIEKHASIKSSIIVSLEVGTSERTLLERFFIGELSSLKITEENFMQNLNNWITFGNSVTKKHYGYSIQDREILNLSYLVENYPTHRKIATICPNVQILYKRIRDWRGMQQGYKAIFGICNPNELGILCNGDVVLCCADYEGGTKIGNLYQESLMDVLTSNKTKRIRKMMSFNVMPTPFCKRCKGYTTLRGTLFSQLKALCYIPIFFRKK